VAHRRPTADQFHDIIQRKGQGTILLLAGPPGCGKTLTAEALAMHIDRPLYALSAGELGTAAVDLERNLQNIFHRASTWGAVLLLDEAYFLIEKRTAEHYRQASLVSVLLRKLE
jgi:SpoVK/Ycf46/Vps4 family AAA+-type ATPase